MKLNGEDASETIQTFKTNLFIDRHTKPLFDKRGIEYISLWTRMNKVSPFVNWTIAINIMIIINIGFGFKRQ